MPKSSDRPKHTDVKLVAVRLSRETRAKLKALTVSSLETQSGVVSKAIEHAYDRRLKSQKGIFRHSLEDLRQHHLR